MKYRCPLFVGGTPATVGRGPCENDSANEIWNGVKTGSVRKNGSYAVSRSGSVIEVYEEESGFYGGNESENDCADAYDPDGGRTVDQEESGLRDDGGNESENDYADEIVSDGGRGGDGYGGHYGNGGCRGGGSPQHRHLRMTKRTDCGRQTGTAVE